MSLNWIAVLKLEIFNWLMVRQDLIPDHTMALLYARVIKTCCRCLGLSKAVGLLAPHNHMSPPQPTNLAHSDTTKVSLATTDITVYAFTYFILYYISQITQTSLSISLTCHTTKFPHSCNHYLLCFKHHK